MNAIPLIPQALEWPFVLWLVFNALVVFVLSSSGERATKTQRHVRTDAANPYRRERGVRGQDAPRSPGDAGLEEGLGPRSPAPPRIKRRQSRARLARQSFQSKQENDARLALYVRERRNRTTTTQGGKDGNAANPYGFGA